MAGKPTIAQAWVGLVPTLQGSQKAIEKDLDGIDVDAPGKKVGKRFGTALATGAVIAGALIVKGLSASIDQASNLNESINAVDVTFGDSAAAVKTLGAEAAKTLGLSNSEFNGLAVQFSAFAKTIAGGGGNVADTLDGITTRASDFASVMNIEVADAAALFQSGLAGETEPLRKYGIDLSAAAVQAYALANGIGDGTGVLTEAEKVQARYGSLMEQTSKTQGDFANTSGEFANQQRILKAKTADLQAEIGTKLLPVMSKLSDIGLKVVDWISQNVSWLGPLTVALGIAAGAIWLVNIAMAANPISLIIIGIALLVAAIVWAYNNVSWFKTGIDALGQAFVWLWDNILKPYITAFTTLWTWMWNSVIKPVVDFIVAYFRLMGDVYLWLWDNILKPYITALGDLWTWLWGNAIKPAVDAIVTALTWLKDQFIERFNLIKTGVGVAIDLIKGYFNQARDNFQSVMDFFSGAVSTIKDTFTRIGDGIKGVFKSAFNGIASMWNNSVGKLSFTVPDIKGVPNRGETFSFPKIPMLADGGFATGSGWSIVGEQGPELRYMPRGASVVPLDRADEFGPGAGRGGGSATFNISTPADPTAVAIRVAQIQRLAAA